MISGGGSGLGRAIAEWFAASGDSVIVVGRRRAPLEETVARLGPNAELVVADVGEVAGAAAVRAAIGERPVHVVVPAAGGTKALIPRGSMRSRGSGRPTCSRT